MPVDLLAGNTEDGFPKDLLQPQDNAPKEDWEVYYRDTVNPANGFVPQAEKAIYQGTPFAKRVVSLMGDTGKNIKQNMDAVREPTDLWGSAGKLTGQIVAASPAIAAAETVGLGPLAASSVGFGAQTGGEASAEGAAPLEAAGKGALTAGLTYAGGKALEGTGNLIANSGKVLGDTAGRINNFIVKLAKNAPYKYGKDPLGVSVKEKITGNTIKDIADGYADRLAQRTQELNEAVANNPETVDLSGVIDSQLKDAANKATGSLQDRTNVLNKLKFMEDKLKAQYGDLSQMSVADAVKLKRQLSDDFPFTPGDAEGNILTKVAHKIHHGINDEIEQAAPEVADLNQRVSSLIDLTKAAKDRVAVESRQNPLGLVGQLALLGGLGAGGGYATHHDPVEGALIGLSLKASASPAVLSRVSKLLAGASEADISKLVTEHPWFQGLIDKLSGKVKVLGDWEKVAKDISPTIPTSDANGLPYGTKALPNLGAEGTYNGVRVKPIVTPSTGEGAEVIPMGEKPLAANDEGINVKLPSAVEQGGESVNAANTPQNYNEWLGDNKLTNSPESREKYLQQFWPDQDVNAKSGLMGNKGQASTGGNAPKLRPDSMGKGYFVTPDGEFLDVSSDYGGGTNDHVGFMQASMEDPALAKKLGMNKDDVNALKNLYESGEGTEEAGLAGQNVFKRGNVRITVNKDSVAIDSHDFDNSVVDRLFSLIKDKNPKEIYWKNAEDYVKKMTKEEFLNFDSSKKFNLSDKFDIAGKVAKSQVGLMAGGSAAVAAGAAIGNSVKSNNNTLPLSRRQEIADVEVYGKVNNKDYAQLTTPAINQCIQNGAIPNGTTKKDVLRDKSLYEKCVKSYWDYLGSKYKIPENERYLWWRMPARYKDTGGDVNSKKLTPEERNVMNNRIKNHNARSAK